MPKFTIITINKNNACGLLGTLTSIEAQIRKDYELICVDGHSTDSSPAVYNRFQSSIHLLLQDEGAGVYAAMNQGAVHASGVWTIFLNSGDRFFSERVLSDFQPDPKSQLAYGRAWIEGADAPAQYNGLENIWRGQPFCHQALFAKTDLIQAMPFDTSLAIAADYKLLVTAYKAGFRFEDLNQDICVIEPPGLSGKQVFKRLREKYVVASDAFPDQPVLRVTIRQYTKHYKNVLVSLLAGKAR